MERLYFKRCSSSRNMTLDKGRRGPQWLWTVVDCRAKRKNKKHVGLWPQVIKGIDYAKIFYIKYIIKLVSDIEKIRHWWFACLISKQLKKVTKYTPTTRSRLALCFDESIRQHTHDRWPTTQRARIPKSAYSARKSWRLRHVDFIYRFIIAPQSNDRRYTI